MVLNIVEGLGQFNDDVVLMYDWNAFLSLMMWCNSFCKFRKFLPPVRQNEMWTVNNQAKMHRTHQHQIYHFRNESKLFIKHLRVYRIIIIQVVPKNSHHFSFQQKSIKISSIWTILVIFENLSEFTVQICPKLWRLSVLKLR